MTYDDYRQLRILLDKLGFLSKDLERIADDVAYEARRKLDGAWTTLDELLIDIEDRNPDYKPRRDHEPDFVIL